MLFRLSRSFAVAALLTAVGATTTISASPPGPTPIPFSQCHTGDAQCCNSVESVQAPGVTAILGTLGIGVADNTIVVGLNCAPITIIGVGGGGNCAEQPVCCSNNEFDGLISLGCTPLLL
ncbi:hydrophobin 2 [Mycena albidolilacea]|uniref:Hydrophobin n=1 Tax=Mycena albidolilacea TaxID=1033008 RepID=A0AAD6ZPY5_9AGAR|nr:hydrophobin 2 [Mycena albidolilacea]